MTEQVLLPGDRHSAIWLRLSKHIGERLEKLRRTNDNEIDQIKTAALRGQIRELKYLLKLAEDVQTETELAAE